MMAPCEMTSDIPDTLDALHATRHMLKAFSVLLEHAHRSGESLQAHSYGIERLLDQQCEDLGSIEKTLSEQFQEIRTDKLEVRDLATVAQWAGVSPQVADRVIAIATGIKLPEMSEHDYRDLAMCAGQVSFLRAMQDASDIEAISDATGVSAETVKLILDEAYLYSPRRVAVIRKTVEQGHGEPTGE